MDFCSECGYDKSLAAIDYHHVNPETKKHNIARILIGEQDAITIIGPASVVKDIKKDPKKIELMLQRR